MGTAFVFDPEGSYSVVGRIREKGTMPAAGLRYVASVTGPYKIFEVVTFDGIAQLTERLEPLPSGGSDDPPNALVFGTSKVRRSTYRAHTALVRIDVKVPDPNELLDVIREAIGSGSDEGVEADVVVGDFDILACVVDDDEDRLGAKMLAIRAIDGVKRTVSLRVIDYVSTSENAPEGHWVSAVE